MSLQDAYSLAHTAQCRLSMAASRPDRNLRFVVGHLMHYEHLRLRIVEIEHDLDRQQRATAVQFKGNGQANHRLQHKPSTGQLGKRSPPPAAPDEDDEDDDEDYDDDMLIGNDEEGLGLTRFPSGAARAPQPPALEPDDPIEDDYDDEDEPASPEEPDQATLERTVKGEGDEGMAKLYEGVRRCPCHGKTDSPPIERVWQLSDGKDGKTRMVAQVA